jgi:hypothetical protein
MTITIHEVPPHTHRSATIALLSRFLNPAYDGARFDWLYSHNPAGSGRLWVALDDADGLVGTAGAFPRRLSMNGEEALGWVLGDFCIAEPYRALGPALALQRACLEALGAQKDTFCYDFPGAAMMPVYKRLQAGSVWLMRRFARVLRAGPRFGRYLRPPLLARAVGAAFDLARAHRARAPRVPAALDISLLEAPCGEDFSALARNVSARYGVCLQRSAEHLNWRYRDNPIRRHEILVARLGGELAAYAVFCHEAAEATLVDVFGFPDPEVIGPLVHTTADLLRERGCTAVSVGILDSHPWDALFERLGFSRRETSPVILFPPSSSTLRPETVARGTLFLTQGDRDS